jgi:hypothetical protein
MLYRLIQILMKSNQYLLIFFFLKVWGNFQLQYERKC